MGRLVILLRFSAAHDAPYPSVCSAEQILQFAARLPACLTTSEPSSALLTSQILQLYQETKGEKPFYSLVNILGFNEQTPQRYYRSWKKESSILTGTVPGESDKTETQLSERVAQIFQSFCQAGIKVTP